MNLETIVQGALSALPGQKKRNAPELTRDQAMSARPIRNPNLRWRENDEGEAVIVLPRRRDWVGKFLAWMFFVPEARPVALDEAGTFVWQNCDGTNSVNELVGLLQEEYKLGRREAEMSLTEFLKMLGKRGMVGFLIPKEIAEQLGESSRQVVGLDQVGTTEEELRQAEARTRADAEEPGAGDDH